jgi:hypothetical protein
MYKVRILFLSLLAVMAVSSVVSSSASAVLQGPWWMKSSGAKQVKIEPKEELQIKSINEGTFTLKSRALLMNVTLECKTVENKGFIWNGPHQGRDEAEVKFSKCFMVAPCATHPFTVSVAKVVTELMWKYAGVSKELTEAGGQQKVHDVFAPKEPPEEFEPGKFRQRFVTITIPAEAEGKKCVINGEFPVYAVGSRAIWEDQGQKPREVIWGTAAQVEPQNKDARVVRLKWKFPNVKKLHVEEVPEEAKLQLGVEPAELEGTIKLEDEFGVAEFGAWDKV